MAQAPADFLKNLNKKLGFVSAPKLLLAAKREALRNGFKAPNLEDAKKAAKTETRELFKAPKSLGKVAALKPGFFQMHLFSMRGLKLHTSKHGSDGRPYKWVLLCVDILTRKACADKVQDHEKETVAKTLRKLLDSE